MATRLGRRMALEGRQRLARTVRCGRSGEIPLDRSSRLMSMAAYKVDRAFDSHEEQGHAFGGRSVGRQFWLLADRGF